MKPLFAMVGTVATAFERMVNGHGARFATPDYGNNVSVSTVNRHGRTSTAPDHENDMGVSTIKNRLLFPLTLATLLLFPPVLHATQMHTNAEGILVHQIGHIFFLISMVILYVTIQSKGLQSENGWRFIQYSALFFALWNFDALLVHFLDNQAGWIRIQILSIGEMDVSAALGSKALALFYYFLRLDHLLCLPGMIFLWRGLSMLLQDQEKSTEEPLQIEGFYDENGIDKKNLQDNLKTEHVDDNVMNLRDSGRTA